jgi:hypothetical protein
MDRNEAGGHAQKGESPVKTKNPGLLVIIGLVAVTVAWMSAPQARAIFIPNPVTNPTVPPSVPPPNPPPTPPDPPTTPPAEPPPCHDTPEPATLLSGLVGGGVLSLAAYRKRARKPRKHGLLQRSAE